MAVETLKTTQVTDWASGAKVQSQLYGSMVQFPFGEVTLPAAASAGSTIELVAVPSNCYPIKVSLSSDGTLDCPDVDVGAKFSDGTNLDDDGMATGLDIDDTGEHDALAGKTRTKQAWQYTSATSDPGGWVIIEASLDVNAVAVGNMVAFVMYVTA